MPSSGGGGANGSGSIAFGYSASGAYSSVDLDMTEGGLAVTAASLGSDFSGTVSASGSMTESYGYSTISTYSSGTGDWSTNGTASGTTSGQTSSSFSASSPFDSPWTADGGTSGGWSISGTATGSGSDWSSYSYSQTQAISNNAWGSVSGSGGVSGGGTATWGYSGTGSYALTQDGGTVNGTTAVSGSVTFAGGFSGAVTLPSGSDAWVQSGGSGQTSGTAQYGYSYSGGGSGLASDGTTWNIPTESGSGNGTNGYNDPLTVLFNSTYGEWSVNESAGSSPTGSYTQQDAYTYQSAPRSEPYYDGYVVGTENYTTSINDNATVVNDTTQTDDQEVTGTSYSGGGTGSSTYNVAASNDPGDWWSDVASGTWSGSGGAEVTTNQSFSDTRGPDAPTGPGSSSGTPGTDSSIPSMWEPNSYTGGFGGPGPEPDQLGGAFQGQWNDDFIDISYSPTGEGTAVLVNPSAVTQYFGTPALPAGPDYSGDPQGSPLWVTVSTRTTPVSSLASLSSASFSAAASSVWGMSFTAAPGYGSGATAPQTQFAAGNNPASLPAFTPEGMLGADSVFGPWNVAPVVPPAWSSIVVGYGFRGVSIKQSGASSAPLTAGPNPQLDPVTDQVKPEQPLTDPQLNLQEDKAADFKLRIEQLSQLKTDSELLVQKIKQERAAGQNAAADADVQTLRQWNHNTAVIERQAQKDIEEGGLGNDAVAQLESFGAGYGQEVLGQNGLASKDVAALSQGGRRVGQVLDKRNAKLDFIFNAAATAEKDLEFGAVVTAGLILSGPFAPFIVAGLLAYGLGSSFGARHAAGQDLATSAIGAGQDVAGISSFVAAFWNVDSASGQDLHLTSAQQGQSLGNFAVSTFFWVAGFLVGGNGEGNCFVAGTPVLVPDDISAKLTVVSIAKPQSFRSMDVNWLLAAGAVMIGIAGYRDESKRAKRARNSRKDGLEWIFGDEDNNVDDDFDFFGHGPRDLGTWRRGIDEVMRESGNHPDLVKPGRLASLGGPRALRESTTALRASMAAISTHSDLLLRHSVPLGREPVAHRIPKTSRQQRNNGRSSILRSGRKWLIAFVLLAGLFASKAAWPTQAPSNVGASLSAVSCGTAAELTSRPIELIHVGQRVIAGNPDIIDSESNSVTAVDPATWRLLRLHADDHWADGTFDKIEVETLQPQAWIAAHGARPGSIVPLPMDLLEMGMRETVRARVVAVEPCPAISHGSGRVVITTINHLNRYVLLLTLTDQKDQRNTIGVTGFHRFYNADRKQWVSAESLRRGDHVPGMRGMLTVESVERKPGIERVYNMTVEHEHVYHVAACGALVHNAGCGPNCFPPGTLVLMADRSRKKIEDVKKGDCVLAFDPEKDTYPSSHRVSATIKDHTECFFHISLRTPRCDSLVHELIATRMHPIWTKDRKWQKAVDIRAEDVLQDEHGNSIAVASTSIEWRSSFSYNLSIDDVHTFFVVNGGVATLVHNAVVIIGNGQNTRVIPYAKATGGITLDNGLTGPEFDALTPYERYKINDGQVRRHIKAGDTFQDVGPDGKPRSFDLRTPELNRLHERGAAVETIPEAEVNRVLGGS